MPQPSVKINLCDCFIVEIKFTILKSFFPVAARGQCDQIFQKLGMGVYDNENQPTVSETKKTEFGETAF